LDVGCGKFLGVWLWGVGVENLVSGEIVNH